MTTTQTGGSGSRRGAMIVLLAVSALGALLLILATKFRAQFESWLQQDLSQRLTLVVAGMTLLSCGPVLGLAAYLWSLGRRAVRAQRYPPPGLRMDRDAPAVIGPDAARLGRAIQFVGAVLVIVAVLLAVFLWRLVVVARSLPHA